MQLQKSLTHRQKDIFMKINPEDPILFSTDFKLTKVKTNKDLFSEEKDPYDLDFESIPKLFMIKEQTTSITCPPCNETMNTCHQSQCCSAMCSGNPNCPNG